MGKINYSIIGSRFGRLTVIDFDHIGPHHVTYWLCECDCGNKTIVSRLNLRSGHTTSCGYNRAIRAKECRTIHGMSKTPLHGIWCHIRQRCGNENDQCYDRYGGRGSHYITYNGVTHTIAEWSRLLNVNYDAFKARVRRGNMRDFEKYYGDSED